MAPSRIARSALVVSLVSSVVVMLFVGGLFASPVSAQDDPIFTGELTYENEPVPDVEITVADIDGSFSETATTDDQGSWTVVVPSKRATYEITLDLETLPNGTELTEGSAATLEISISQPGQVRRPQFQLGEQENTGTPIGEQIAQSFVNGVKLGLIIALCSVGLSLVFGTTGLINFAHGELVSFGAVLALWLNTVRWSVPLVLAATIAFIATGLLGAATEKGIMAPLRRRQLGAFQFVVVTIGLSLIGRQLLQMWIGSEPQSYREYQIQTPWDLGLFRLTPRDFTIMVVCAVGLVVTASVLQYTRWGKATRAVSDNASLASASGIAVDSVVLRVWIAGAALAGLGGVMFGLSETVQYDMGFRLLLLIFAAVILGGLGTAYGAMVGGLIIGVVTEVSTVWLQTELKFVWALLALVIVLLVRPQGILGQSERVG